MDQFTTTITSVIDKFGRTYFIVGYIPALLFTLIHQFTVFPIWLGHPLDIFIYVNHTAQNPTNISITLSTLIISIVIGILILSLKTLIFLGYEGKFWILHHVILYPLYLYNLKTAERLYSEIVQLRQVYRDLVVELQRADEVHRIPLQQRLDGISIQIEEAFENVEQKQMLQTLPLRKHRVMPTSLGNVMAVAEEYPYDRYGIDSVLIWPRLMPLLDNNVPEQALRLTNQKIILDMNLSLSFVFGFMSFEALIMTKLFSSVDQNALLFAFLGGAILCYLFYRAGVTAARDYASLIMTSFDYYRHILFDQLQIPIPEKLEIEQIIWLKIAAFFRRGDAFYWREIYEITQSFLVQNPEESEKDEDSEGAS